MKVLFYIIHTGIIYIVVISETFILSICASLSGLIDPYSALSNWIIKTWARIILWISGIHLTIDGLENIDHSKSYIFMMNHLSLYDIPASFIAVPLTSRFIAKKELFKIPILSTGMRLTGMLEIDRGNSTEAKKTLEKAAQTINDGCSVIIFPEGTRSKNGEMQSFKKGGFIIAIQGGIPILPMVISGTQYIVRKGSGLVKRGKIHIRFLTEISTGEYSYESRNNLVRKVHQVMLAEYNPEYNKKE